jgi:hypothetical protein
LIWFTIMVVPMATVQAVVSDVFCANLGMKYRLH